MAYSSTNNYRAARELRREMTPGEAAVWEAVRGRRFHGLKFYRQRPYGKFVLDFYCPELRVAVEVDGAVHDDPGQRRVDEARVAWLNEQDIRVVRIPTGAAERNALRSLERALGDLVPLSSKEERG